VAAADDQREVVDVVDQLGGDVPLLAQEPLQGPHRDERVVVVEAALRAQEPDGRAHALHGRPGLAVEHHVGDVCPHGLQVRHAAHAAVVRHEVAAGERLDVVVPVVLDRRMVAPVAQVLVDGGEPRLEPGQQGVHLVLLVVLGHDVVGEERQPAVEQHDRGRALGMARGEARGDVAAHRVTHDDRAAGPGVVQRGDQVGHVRGHPVGPG
jgi:hypothetical protein